MRQDICESLDPLIEDECKAVLEYSDILKIIDEKYKQDIIEILKDESDHFLKLNKIKEEIECERSEIGEMTLFSDYKEFDIDHMKNMSIDDIIKLYQNGYRV